VSEAFLQEESAQVLSALRRMAGESGRLRTSSATAKLCTALGLPRVSVNEALRELYRAGLVSYQPDGQQLPASGYMSVQAAAVEPVAHEIFWRQALEDAQVESGAAVVLAQLAPAVADMNAKDMQALAHALQALRGISAESSIDDAGFNVSARHLMGSSKVLARLSRQMLAAAGLPGRLHAPSPRYILCAGPSEPGATLLIENPRAFENAIRSGLTDEVAIVCTFGFGLSYLGSDIWADDQMPQHDRPIRIVRGGAPPPLGQLLAAEKVYLWGDLDLAAMDIFRSLKGAIPQLRMSAIYEEMVPMLSDPSRSHPYAALFDKGGQLSRYQDGCAVPSRFNDEDVAMLQAACSARAVDQEAVEESSIRRLGALPLCVIQTQAP
jgi:DNA-binding transcriptional ArsR family regulator